MEMKQVTERMALSVIETEKVTGLSARTIWTHTFPRGTLKCCRVGNRVLYRPCDVDAWLASLSEGGAR